MKRSLLLPLENVQHGDDASAHKHALKLLNVQLALEGGERLPKTAEDIHRFFMRPLIHEAIELLHLADIPRKHVRLATDFVEMAEMYHELMDSLPTFDDPRVKDVLTETQLKEYKVLMNHLQPLLEAMEEQFRHRRW